MSQLCLAHVEHSEANRVVSYRSPEYQKLQNNKLIDLRYDTIEEFNMDSKAEYSALSSTRSQKKRTKTNASAPLIQYSHEGTVRFDLI